MTQQELQTVENAIRGISIICINNPEWGTWGVFEDRGSYFEIHGRPGFRVLDKSEALRFWAIKR